MLVLDEGEGVEAGGRQTPGRLANQLVAAPLGVGVEVQRDGVADEGVVDEDSGQRVGAGGVEAELDVAVAGQLGADFEALAVEADGAVFADVAAEAVEEDFVEGLARLEGAKVVDLLEPVLPGDSARRGVLAGVVLGSQPGVVLGGQVEDADRARRQFILHLLAPGAVPALDDALGLRVPGLGIQQAHFQLGADGAQGLGDVGRAAVDVVGAPAAVGAQHLLEAHLVVDGVLAFARAPGEAAVGDVPGGAVDFRQEDGFAESALLVDDRVVDVQPVAHQQVAGEFVEEGAALGPGPPGGPLRGVVGLEQPVDAGLLQDAGLDLLGPLQNPDDAFDGPPGLLGFQLEDELPQVLGHRPRHLLVPAHLGEEPLEAARLVLVVPSLDGARRQLHDIPAGAVPGTGRSLAAVLHQVPVLQSGPDEGAQHRHAEQRYFLSLLLVHGRAATCISPPLGVGWHRPRSGAPSDGQNHDGYMRRTPGESRCSSAASGANSVAPTWAANSSASARRSPSSPTARVTSDSAAVPAVASTCPGSRALCRSRAAQRCAVLSGTTGSPAARVPCTALSTTSQVRRRHRARKAGSTRHVAWHAAHRKTITVMVATPPAGTAVPQSTRSRRPWMCSVRRPHRHCFGRYDAGSRIRASCVATSWTDSSMSVPPRCPLDESLETRHSSAAGGAALLGHMGPPSSSDKPGLASAPSALQSPRPCCAHRGASARSASSGASTT